MYLKINIKHLHHTAIIPNYKITAGILYTTFVALDLRKSLLTLDLYRYSTINITHKQSILIKAWI